jgi:CRISPR-associated endonuclease/helicase Cas3
MFPELLAKSRKDNEQFRPSMLLTGHLADVYCAATRVLDATQEDQLSALGLPVEQYRDRLRRIVLLAAAVHDLGKANDHFQGMIRGTRDVRNHPQGLRHEWVTLLMLQRLRDWFLPPVGGNEYDFAFVEWAVTGHHPAHDHASPPRLNPAGAGPVIEFLTGHNDFQAALVWLAKIFGLPNPPALPTHARNLVGSANVFAEIAQWSRKSQRIWDKVRNTPDARLVAAAKNALVAGDVAGSALPKAKPDDPQRWEWISASFADKPEPGDLQRVVEHRLKGSTPRQFQEVVAASKAPVTLLKAGCGTGKTLGAYLWAAANHPTRRLYYCYPTTGTATEGFKDYLFEPSGELGDIGAKLFHSRRDVDFDIILTAGKDTESADADVVARLESMEAWSTPVVACTVDTVLGLVQNNKRGLFAWPALAQSAFVFDEIHAYDDRLFGALLRFLRDLPCLPALMMTASLPKAREDSLVAALGEVGRDLNQIPTKEQFEQWEKQDPRETLPRYRKVEVANNDPLPVVHATLESGGKVLWVCNTVHRAMTAADVAAELASLTASGQVLIYHSRFKYQDRVKRHKAMVEAFDPKLNPGRALAVCTQVAEMSLDLSADLLVTDLAPVPALIQRLGRLNRRAKAGDPAKPFVVIEPHDHLPYTPAELNAARKWLANLHPDGISQRHLAEKWEQRADQPPEMIASAWLDGGPATTVRELREASRGITVLMEDDKARVRAKPRHLARLVLPMPPPGNLNWRAWPKFRGVPVAPTGTIIYDDRAKLRGAEWRK